MAAFDSRPKTQFTRLSSRALTVLLVQLVLAGLAFWVGQMATMTLVARPGCVAACEAAGSTLDGIFSGSQATGPSSCVCKNERRIPTNGVDLSYGLGAGLGITVWVIAFYAASAWAKKKGPVAT